MPAAAPPRLVLVVHGTASERGQDDSKRLAAAVSAARPDLVVELAYLDVVRPRIAEILDRPGPAIVVPALLATGFHVEQDIPNAIADAIARRGVADLVLTPHLGPDPLIVDALVDRLAGSDMDRAGTIALVAAGSRRPGAAIEVGRAATSLAARIGRDVETFTVGAELPGLLAALPRPVVVASYLLAEGQFMASIRAAAGDGRVSAPLAEHPGVVAAVLARYDEARDARDAGGN
jgi:sirohydrochlorin ferrochelatase